MRPAPRPRSSSAKGWLSPRATTSTSRPAATAPASMMRAISATFESPGASGTATAPCQRHAVARRPGPDRPAVGLGRPAQVRRDLGDRRRPAVPHRAGDDGVAREQDDLAAGRRCARSRSRRKLAVDGAGHHGLVLSPARARRRGARPGPAHRAAVSSRGAAAAGRPVRRRPAGGGRPRRPPSRRRRGGRRSRRTRRRPRPGRRPAGWSARPRGRAVRAARPSSGTGR